MASSSSSMFETLARVERGGLTESCHLGAVAVVGSSLQLVARVGDPEVATFLRSAAKPFQAVPLLLAGGERMFGLEDADLALICGSHNGTRTQCERATSILAKAGLTPQSLHCGVQAPLDVEEALRLSQAGLAPTALHNNCSGNHAGQLLTAKALDLAVDDYEALAHPLQQRVLEEVSRFTQVAISDIGMGIDGCSLPAYHLPLSAIARAYGMLADPHGAGLDSERAEALSRLGEAMARAPEMVAGPGEFTTNLIRETQGRVLGKEGAEGFYGIAVRGPARLGVVLKLADGGSRAREAVVLELLRQLGVLSGAEMEALASFRSPLVTNRRGLEVGRIVADLEVRHVQAVQEDG